MIEQIRKFKKGGNSGPSLKEAKTAYEQAWETASPALRHNAQALINYAEKLRRNNRYSTLEDAQGMLDIYNEATNILSGSKDPILTSSKTWGTHAISDFYDYQKLYSPSSSAVGSPLAASLPTYEDFKPTYFDTIGLTDGDTFQDRLYHLINSISSTLTQAKYKKDAGIELIGYNKNLYDKTDAIVRDLHTLKTGLEEGTNTPREVWQRLLQLQSDLGFDSTQWDSYFGSLDDPTLEELNLKNLIQNEHHRKYDPARNEAPWLDMLDKSKQYRFTLGDDGKIYVWDKNYNAVTDSFIKLRKGTQDHLVIHNGKLYYGDIFNDSLQKEEDIVLILQNYANNYEAKLGEPKAINLTSNTGSEDPVLNALIQTLKKNGVSNTEVINIQHILGTDQPVYAYTKNSKLPLTKYGKLDLDKVEFFTSNGNGGYQVVSDLQDMISSGLVDKTKINFLPDADPSEMPLAYSYNNIFKNQDALLDNTTFVGTRKADNLISLGFGTLGTLIGGPLTGTATGLATKWITKNLQNTIADNPPLFVSLVIQALKNPNRKINIPNADDVTGNLFLQSFGDIQAVLNTAGLLVLSGEVTLNAADFNLLKDAYLNFYNVNPGDSQNDGVIFFKSGGIVKAEEGTTIQSSNWSRLRGLKRSISELHKAELAAKEAGYETLAAAEADKSTDLTTSDYMRFATMAADVSSIVASFVPGIGTGVAAGMGVVSMGTDLVADVLDPAISTGQVIKNLGMNAAFAATGLIPGAKMHKVTASLIKWAPKLITAVSALGIATDESTQLTLKKLSEGKKELTHADWRNLARILSVVAGGTRMAKGSYDKAKLKYSITATDNVKLKGVKTADGSDFELPKEKVKEINQALKKAKTPEDVDKIKLKYNDIPDEAFKIPEVNDKGKFKGTASLVETDKSSAGAVMREIWNKEAEIIRQQAKENPKWFEFANKYGGGAYSGKLRAILSNPELAKEYGFDVTKYLEYKGAYNPMYDSKGIRTKAGMIGAQSKSLKPAEVSTPKSTPAPTAETTSLQNTITPITHNPTIGPKFNGQVSNLAGPELGVSYNRNLRNMLTAKRVRMYKPYNGIDEGAKGIHVSPITRPIDIDNKLNNRHLDDRFVAGHFLEKSLDELSGLRQRQAHGMSKTTSFKDVEDLLTGGIGQTKYTSGGADGLYTALLFGQVDPGAGAAIGTASGKAVTSGHAVLVAKEGKKTIKSLDDISEILLNDGGLGDDFIPMLKYFQLKFPLFKFVPYSQAKAYYSTTKKHGGQLKYQYLRK